MAHVENVGLRCKPGMVYTPLTRLRKGVARLILKDTPGMLGNVTVNQEIRQEPL